MRTTNVAAPRSEADFRALLDAVVSEAATSFGPRLLAVYAIGSLAHGGFSPLCSDVDAAIILDDPLAPGDGEAIAMIAADCRPLPFGDRLSIFWGSPSTLRGETVGGRFPPHDLLDLARYGHLLLGTEQRGLVAEPDPTDLLIASTAFAVERFGNEPLPTAADTVAAGPRAASKQVLFPVRFLYTAQTGEMGLNERAVEHYEATHAENDRRRGLVSAAFGWRRAWKPGDPAAAGLLEHAPAIYLELIDDLVPRMRSLGRDDLVAGLTRWRATFPRA